jgi:hypothetical protein
MKPPVALCLVLLVAGCSGSQGFDRTAMQAIVQSSAEAAGQAPAGSSHVTAEPPRLPFRLALFFVQQAFPPEQSLRAAEWVGADKERLSGWLAPLRQEGILSDLFFLVDPTIRNADGEAIRQAASRYGADAVLMVRGVGAVDRYDNGYAALYPTLIGAYFAPGTHSDALFLISGTLHPVRSNWRETQTVEGHAEMVGPTMAVHDAPVLTRAKQAALDELGQRMAAMLRRLKP